MTHPSLAAVRARLERFASTGDPRQVLAPEADTAARLLAESLRTSWSDEAGHVLGWFHWYRCAAQRTYDTLDFHHALEFLRPLWERMPEAVPEPVGAVLARTADPRTRAPALLQLAVGLVKAHLRDPSAEAARQAGAYVEQAVRACGEPADARTRGILDALTSVVPQHLAQGQPDLLRARAAVLRALLAHPAVNEEERRTYRTDLGTCLRLTHAATGERVALDEAVDALRAALSGVGATDDTGPDAVRRMAGLANALKSRGRDRWRDDAGGAGVDGAREDIAEAERWARRAHGADPEDVNSLSCLGNVLREKALLLDDVAALRESARLHHAAARTMDPASPAYVTQLMNAALPYQESATVTGELADADAAVAVLRTAVEHADVRHPEHVSVRVELGHSLTLRANLAHDDRALAEGRRLLESVVAGLPHDHPEARRAKSHLVDSYRVEFQLSSEQGLLDASLRLARDHVADPSLDDDERGRFLRGCVRALAIAYDRTHDRRLLDELLPICRSAVRFSPAGTFHRSHALLELGVCLVWLYEVARDGVALREAMDVLDEVASGPEALRTTPDAMARLAEARLHHLRQFAPLTGLVHERELDAIVDLCRKALALRAPGSRERAVSLSYLAVVLLGRARERTSAVDAREAAELLREAVRTGPDDHRDRPVWHTNLVGALLDAHRYDGDASVLDEAESVAREAATAAGADELQRVRALWMLSHVLARRDGEGGDSAAEVLALRLRVYRTPLFPLPERLSAATGAGALAASQGDWEGAVAHYEVAVDLLPRLVGRRLARADRELLLADEPLIASQAAACALQLGDPHKALDLLERGRGILLGQLTETRRDLSDLRRQAPELADEFGRLSEDLVSHDALADRASPQVPGAAWDQHRLTVRSWERVRDKIRELPGFESFLRPGLPDLGALTEDGPVVVFNLARIRSDAIVLADGTATCVPLPRADLASAADRFVAFSSAVGVLHAPHVPAEQRWEAGTAVLDTLAWLWEAIAEPVVTALGLEPAGDTDDDVLPRLWWCPTGILSFLPLHAAGRYADGAPRGIADYVMSSYTATLNALRPKDAAHAHHRTGHSRVGGDPRLLVVATPQAPGAEPLRYAAADAQALAELFPRATVLTGEAATKRAVLRALPDHTWAHFACHTRADPFARSANALVLQDGSLSLPDLSTLSLDAEFAFLASCGSAAGAYHLADEAHHVASSFQLAGFAHVLATLWEVADGDATEVTTTVYGLLADGVPPAKAIHRATRDLRRRYPRSPWLWAPYVHMGL